MLSCCEAYEKSAYRLSCCCEAYEKSIWKSKIFLLNTSSKSINQEKELTMKEGDPGEDGDNDDARDGYENS